MEQETEEELIRIEHRRGFALVQVLARNVDMYNIARLRESMETAFQLSDRVVIVSLANTRHIDSSAFGGFLKIHELMAGQERKFCLVDLPPDIQRAAQFLQIGKLVQIYPTLADATSDLGLD